MYKTPQAYRPYTAANTNAAVVCVPCFLASTANDWTEFPYRPRAGDGSEVAARAWLVAQGVTPGEADYEISYETPAPCDCCVDDGADAFLMVSWPRE